MQTLDKYQVLEKIGVGGFGVVYKAYDPFIKRHVAIKTCTSEETETRERFMREAEIAGNLHHRNIVTVYDFGFQEGVPYLVQEYLTGEDLDRKIKRRDFLSLPEKLLYLVQIARGLQYAHSRGVVHRDIKPANIRILEDDTAKIMDFGIAKLAQQQETLTQEGITLGTAAYLAPEQIRGGAFDARTDLFSFGVLAFELLAFERPFQGAEISAVFYKILNEAAPPLAREGARLPGGARSDRAALSREGTRRSATPNCTDLLHDIETLAHRRPGAAADPHATAQLTARTARAPQAAEPTTAPTPPTPPTPLDHLHWRPLSRCTARAARRPRGEPRRHRARLPPCRCAGGRRGAHHPRLPQTIRRRQSLPQGPLPPRPRRRRRLGRMALLGGVPTAPRAPLRGRLRACDPAPPRTRLRQRSTAAAPGEAISGDPVRLGSRRSRRRPGPVPGSSGRRRHCRARQPAADAAAAHRAGLLRRRPRRNRRSSPSLRRGIRR